MKAASPGISVFDERALEYDRWFDENPSIYEAEIEAMKRFVPQQGMGLEVGIGTGRFAMPFAIQVGIDPAYRALKTALAREIAVCQAFGERLPFKNDQFDFVQLITVDPFVADFSTLLREAYRVLVPEGHAILGVIDKDSPLGQIYESEKGSDPFYRTAHFHSADEIHAHLRRTGFGPIQSCQTLIGIPALGTPAGKIHSEYHEDFLSVMNDYGEGGFVVFNAQKPRTSKNAKR
jgi:ubiquinone/menaquinone biosynthesis C-methylase UbiE